MKVSVCVATFDRPHDVVGAIESCLAQHDPVVEVVVANNGDPSNLEPARNAFGARDDVVLVDVPHAGLGDSRNQGAMRSHGEWIAFLDDDDRLLPDWSKVITSMISTDVGLVSASARFVDIDGRQVGEDPATTRVELAGDVIGTHLAGCFAVRRDLFDAAGGYLPGLACSHQTELWIRLVAVARGMGLRIESDARYVTDIRRGDNAGRPLSASRLFLDGGRWLASRHREHFGSLPRDLANIHGSNAVNAVRLGEHRLARHLSQQALRTDPSDPKRWVRAALMRSQRLSRRLWPGGIRDESAVARNSSTIVRELARRTTTTDAGRGSDPAAVLHEDRAFNDLLFLPWRYECNAPASSDTDADSGPFWEGDASDSDVRYQTAVYKWAARLAGGLADDEWVVDVGCGTGDKLVGHVGRVTDRHVGVDQESGIAIARERFPAARWVSGDLSQDAPWQSLSDLRIGLVICSDVIEHVPDPYELLDRLRDLTAGRLLVSTPDRARLDGVSPLGPPRNPRHVREWTADEFELLLEAAGFRVVSMRHFLPRTYSWSVADIRRTLGRLRRGMAVPDRRSNMAFLVEPA